MEITIRGGKRNGEKQVVTCGKCGACLYNRVEDWTIRLTEENRVSTNAWFVTLTYDDLTLPVNKLGVPTLHKPDYQKFLKRLRKAVTSMDDKDYNDQMVFTPYDKVNEKTGEVKKVTRMPIRYYCVGEYGTRTKRPHYHLILFNVPTSKIYNLDKIWKKGRVHLGEVNSKSIAYTVSYHVTAKLQEWSEKMQVEPEFATMSRNPGIGASYFESDAIKWHEKKELRLLFDLDTKKGFLGILKNESFQKKRGQRLLKSAEFYRSKQTRNLGIDIEILKNMDLNQLMGLSRESISRKPRKFIRK